MGSGSWSRNPEDLSEEPLLRTSPKIDIEGEQRPSIGKYVLLSKLGEGGMGVVYHATHKTLGNEVAIKLRPRGPQRAEEELLARFVREAQIAARLRSPHLVSVLDIDEDEPSRCDFIVMEYVDGVSGSGWLKKFGGRAPEAEALDVCIAATRGLEAAHLQGIVHRDIKPANVLIPCDADGRTRPDLAKLCDLGLARAEACDEGITRTQVMMGTPGYMAPEQAASARRAGKPADVLGMGATLFKLLTGRAPFVDPSNDEWLMWTIHGKHTDAAELRPDLAPTTLTLLETCLKLDPAERFPDASALLAALELCRNSVGGDMDAVTYVGDVRSLVDRSEQGLPVLSTTDVRPKEQHPPAQPDVAPEPSRTARPSPPSRPPPPSRPSRPRASVAPRSAAPPPEAADPQPLWVDVTEVVADDEYASPQPSQYTGPPPSQYAGPPPSQSYASQPPSQYVSQPPSQAAPRGSQAPLILVLVGVAAAAIGLLAWSPWNAGGGGGSGGTGATAGEPGLHVTSEPPGAKVVVDGKERGRTPLLVRELRDGAHAVRVSLDDHESWSSTDATTDDGEHTPLHVVLERSVGGLVVRGGAARAQVTLTRRGEPPHSRTFALDGTGAASLSDIEAGAYDVRVTTPGEEPFVGEVRISRTSPEKLVLGKNR